MSAIDPTLHPVTPERRRSTSHMSPEPDSLHLVARDMPIARHDIFEEDANLGSSPESPSERLARHTYKRGENVLVRHMRRSKFVDNLPPVLFDSEILKRQLSRTLPLRPPQLPSLRPHLRA